MKNAIGHKILKIFFIGLCSTLIFSACGKSSFIDSSQSTQRKLDFLPDPSSNSPGSGEGPEMTNIDPESENQTPLPENPQPIAPPTPQATQAPVDVPSPVAVELAPCLDIVLETEIRVRTLKDNILEVVRTLNVGDVIRIEKNLQVVNLHFRNDEGKSEFSSTGFYPHVQILKTSLSAEEMKALNEISTGLYITSIISSEAQVKSETSFKPLTTLPAGQGYLTFFEESGRPKSVWTKKALERFPNLNKGVLFVSMKPAEQKKWSAIMGELQRVADRTRRTPKDLLIIDSVLAKKYSLDFAEKGIVYPKGAWSVAVKETAVRYGFGDVPCAEFMGEVVRQAYARAGYSHNLDFNEENKNILSVTNDAPLVFNFSAFLARGGWIPWDAQIYIPPMGAVLMHNYGYSPGHTYMAAGSDGRFIIDNGSPEGRDLRAASEKSIRDMYQTGVFFLPPGFTPETWESRRN